MALTVAELAVRISGDTAEIRREMNRVSEAMRDVQAATGQMSQTLGGAIDTIDRVQDALEGAAQRAAAFAVRAAPAIAIVAAALLPVAAAAGSVFAGFKLLNSEIGRSAVFLQGLGAASNGVDDEIRAIADSLDLSSSAVALFDGQIENSLLSRGLPSTLSDEILRAATNLQFLAPEGQNASSAMAALQAAIDGNVEPLSRFGINVADIREQMAQFPRDVANGERATIALSLALQAISDKAREAERVSGDLGVGIQDATGLIQVFSGAAAQAASEGSGIQMLIAALNRLAPIAEFAGSILGSAFNAAAVVVSRSINFIIDAFDRLLKTVQLFFRRADALLPDLFGLDKAGDIADAIGRIRDELSGVGDLGEGPLEFTSDVIDQMAENAIAATRETRTLGQALQDANNAVQGGSGLVSGVIALAQAQRAYNEEANAANALQLFNQLNAVFGDVLVNGTASIDAVIQRLQIFREAGFISGGAFDQLLEVFNLVRDSAEIVEDQARVTREEINGQSFAGGEAHANNLAGTVSNATQVVADLGNQWVATASLIASTPIQGQVLVGSAFNAATGLTGGPGSTLPGAPRSGFDQGFFNSINEIPEFVREVDKSTKGLTDATGDLAREARRGRLDTNLDSLADLFPGAGGGGGGGSTAQRSLATLEEIRQLMSAVRIAIDQGIRGGVGIGTDGNVVPLIGNSFLATDNNGNVSIESVLIRGVWDFSDPAAKRQIITQLQDLLADLQKERA